MALYRPCMLFTMPILSCRFNLFVHNQTSEPRYWSYFSSHAVCRAKRLDTQNVWPFQYGTHAGPPSLYSLVPRNTARAISGTRTRSWWNFKNTGTFRDHHACCSFDGTCQGARVSYQPECFARYPIGYYLFSPIRGIHN